MTDTLATEAERIIRELSGGDIPNDSPYKVEFVVLALRDGYREDLRLELLERRNGESEDKSAPGIYWATFIGDGTGIPLQEDSLTKRIYIDLPSTNMSLKYGKDIRVSNVATPMLEMIPVANPGVTMHLRHSTYEKKNYGYYQEGKRLYWMRNVMRDGMRKVILKMLIPAPDTWGLNDPLPVLAANVARVREMVKQRILNRLPQDRLNDNNPNLRVTNG